MDPTFTVCHHIKRCISAEWNWPEAGLLGPFTTTATYRCLSCGKLMVENHSGWWTKESLTHLEVAKLDPQ